MTGRAPADGDAEPGPPSVEADPDDVAIESFAGLPPVDVLLTAAAGCGKTEALAQRTARLVRDGHVAPQQRILGVTFSKKARDNLRSRIRRQMSLRELGLVDVRNFHGLAWRLIAAHGNVIGLDSAALSQPTKRQHAARQEAAGITWRNRDVVAAALRVAKSRRQTNEGVLAELEAAGDPIALAYERALQASGEIDFDDLLRLACRILQNEEVARGYQQHYAAVLVDEVQDLSVTQLEMVQQLGGNRISYAGDAGQGIYAFAGAEPETVFADINSRVVETLELTRSFRSSPAVLAAVNTLTALHGQTPLRCADPSAWGDDAVCLTGRFPTLAQEAARITEHAAGFLTSGATVGVIARTGPRLAALRVALDAAGLAYTDWSAPLSDANVLASLRREAPAAAAQARDEGGDEVTALEHRCRDLLPEADLDERDAVTEACAALRDLMGEHQIELGAALSRCRSARPTDAPVPEGLHLLNAHTGKGQEFDHVVVAGLEEGILPFYRSLSDPGAVAEELRTLTVMVSRARTSLLVTCTADVPNSSGRSWIREPSRWLPSLEASAAQREA